MSLKNIKERRKRNQDQRRGRWGVRAKTREKVIVEEMGWRERGVRHCLTSEVGRRPSPSFDQRFVKTLFAVACTEYSAPPPFFYTSTDSVSTPTQSPSPFRR
jgi:hypothetical protein